MGHELSESMLESIQLKNGAVSVATGWSYSTGVNARRGRCVLFQSTGNQLFLGEGDGAVQEASSVQFRPSVMSNSL